MRGTMTPVSKNEETQREHVSRYNRIGISAVAAAMRYNSGSEKPTEAPKDRYFSAFTADAA
jgi:hypothetical protein